MNNKKRVALTLQENTQRKPWFAFKYNRRSVGSSASKRKAPPADASNDLEAGPSKKQATRETEESIPTVMDPMDISDVAGDPVVRNERNIVGASIGQRGGAGGQVRGEAILPTGLPQPIHTQTRTYTKQYQFRISTTPINASRTDRNFDVNIAVQFPVHDFPVHLLCFYLSDTEIEQLKFHSAATVKHCSVKTYCTTAVLPFVTNQSTTAIANNNIGVRLNTYHDMSKVRYGRLQDESDEYTRERCWGHTLQEIVPADASLSTYLGGLSAENVVRNWDMRYFHFQNLNSLPDNVNYSPAIFTQMARATMFPINRYIKEKINISINEGLIDEWEYSPKQGLVAGQFLVTGTSSFSFNNDITQLLTSFDPSHITLNNSTEQYANVTDQATGVRNTEPRVQPVDASEPTFFTTVSYTPGAVSLLPFVNYARSVNHRITIDSPFVTRNGVQGSFHTPTLCIGLDPLLDSGLNNIVAYTILTMDVTCTIELENGSTNQFSSNNAVTAPALENVGMMAVYRFGVNTGITTPYRIIKKNLDSGYRRTIQADRIFTSPDRQELPTETTWPITQTEPVAKVVGSKEDLEKEREKFKQYQKHDESNLHIKKHSNNQKQYPQTAAEIAKEEEQKAAQQSKNGKRRRSLLHQQSPHQRHQRVTRSTTPQLYPPQEDHLSISEDSLLNEDLNYPQSPKLQNVLDFKKMLFHN